MVKDLMGIGFRFIRNILFVIVLTISSFGEEYVNLYGLQQEVGAWVLAAYESSQSPLNVIAERALFMFVADEMIEMGFPDADILEMGSYMHELIEYQNSLYVVKY